MPEPTLPSAVVALADWSPWLPFIEAARTAPRLPGVYLVRHGAGSVVYVGHAGAREGSGKPKGLHGRLSVYTSGKALTSGLGEAVADRALADPAFLAVRLAEARRGEPLRAKEWGKATIEWGGLEACWATTADKASAEALEHACGNVLPNLWNRRRLGGRAT